MASWLCEGRVAVRKPLAGASIVTAAFLLFVLEPLIAKRILPWFGGSSAVWAVCLVFYQVALLAGYFYASKLAQWGRLRFHLALLGPALLLLPIGPSARWQTLGVSEPAVTILLMLATTIGLPFIALSATSPLLQDALSRSGEDEPYRFFAWSNFASLAALLAYPLLIEPYLDVRQQSVWWSVGFVLFALLCGAFTWAAPRNAAMAKSGDEQIMTTQPLYWFALSACGSMLLLAITNHIDANVAAVPLLWVLPLAVYLLSFIVTFSSRSLYRRWLWLRLLAFALAMLAYAAYDIAAVLPIQISVPVYLAGLFIGCVFCQGELYLLRPPKSQLTGFYLAIAFGGAAGAVFVGLIAPLIFGGIYELPLSMTLIAALALLLTWQTGGWGARVLWGGVTVAMALVFFASWRAYGENALALRRSFYGSLRVVESEGIRNLFHGTVRHGSEFMAPAQRMQATTYYGADSGAGIVLREWPGGAKRVGIVGLGAGTLAVYGNNGDTFRFYEINPQVVQLAREFFFFLKQSKATVEMVEGDARLSLEREGENQPRYDVLVLDAFSGDAIPVHLLTKEAMELYARRLQPQGVMAFHVSNNYLDLTPVVTQLAADAGYQSMVVRNHADQENQVLAAEWVIVTKNSRLLENDALRLHAVPIAERRNLRLWTDDFNSLLPILKAPEIR